MKRIVGAVCVVIVVLLAGINLRGSVQESPPKKFPPSCGYTIIEFGLGIDCNGDTIKVVKKNGVQVVSYDK